MSVRIIVLAAGQGTRMKSTLPKVLHPVAGAPLIEWVVEACRGARPDETTVVIGHGGEITTLYEASDLMAATNILRRCDEPLLIDDATQCRQR